MNQILNISMGVGGGGGEFEYLLFLGRQKHFQDYLQRLLGLNTYALIPLSAALLARSQVNTVFCGLRVPSLCR